MTSGASPARDGDGRLAEIAARAEAATPGPWEADAMDSGHSRFEMNVWVSTAERGDSICSMDGLARWNDRRNPNDDGRADAEFIAAARDDVPWLLAEVERLRAERDGYARANEILRRKNDERVAAVAALNRVRALCDGAAAESVMDGGLGYATLDVITVRAAADVPEAPQ